MAPHPSTLAWKIPYTGEHGGLPSMGSHSVGHASGACKRRGPWRGALQALVRRLRSPAHPCRRLAPACARVPPRLAASGPPGASLLRLGNWGPGLAHAPPAPAPRGAGGWELESFFRPSWLFFLSALHPRLGGKLPLTFAGTPGGLLDTTVCSRGQRWDRGATCARHS